MTVPVPAEVGAVKIPVNLDFDFVRVTVTIETEVTQIISFVPKATCIDDLPEVSILEVITSPESVDADETLELLLRVGRAP